jgi:hypothetical protein
MTLNRKALQRKVASTRHQAQFQTAEELLVKDVLRAENNKLVVYNLDNSVQTIIELDSSGRLKFSQRTVNSSDNKEVITD